MRIADLQGKNVIIWGVGREGVAVAAYIRSFLPDFPLVWVDEKDGASNIEGFSNARVVRGKIEEVVHGAEIIIKSPGVSLYHPLLEEAKKRGAGITSLLNLWMAENSEACVIGVTGTKGKSTTSTLLAHVLTKLGKRAALAGNIGIPLSRESLAQADYVVYEISSYQAASFDGMFAIGVMTNLYQEHLDWHRSLDAYHRDKASALVRSKRRVIGYEALRMLLAEGISVGEALVFGETSGLHFDGGVLYSGAVALGAVENEYLCRAHNRHNVCAVIAVVRLLGLDESVALRAMADYRGLPHRQQMVGEREGITFIDDSISTTPQSTMAAMEVFGDKPLTVIVGGFDRGVDYAPLVEAVVQNKIMAVVCMGANGAALFRAFEERGFRNAFLVEGMKAAVALASDKTPLGGRVLLSPAAPSFDAYEDYIARAADFARAVEG